MIGSSGQHGTAASVVTHQDGKEDDELIEARVIGGDNVGDGGKWIWGEYLVDEEELEEGRRNMNDDKNK